MNARFALTADGDALLAAIHADVDDMTLRLAFMDWSAENEDVIRNAIAFSQAKLPTLTHHGLGVNFICRETLEQTKVRLEDARLGLLQLTKQVALSMAWLAGQTRRASVDQGFNSYTYKHCVERYFQNVTELCMDYVYITSGAFIAAAVAMGVPYKEMYMDPRDVRHVWFGISRNFRKTKNVRAKAGSCGRDSLERR